MSRPPRASDLISVRSGETEFRKGDWWSPLKDARLFFPKGFQDAMADLDLNTIEPLLAHSAEAARIVGEETDWTKSLPARLHWRDCARGQFTEASGEKPMLLPKLVIALEALQLYSKSLDPAKNPKAAAFDVYKTVTIVPGVYRAQNWTVDAHTAAKQDPDTGYKRFLDEARKLGQEKPELVLHDLAKGLHGTYPVVNLVAQCFRCVTVEIAVRPPKAGVAPASSWIRPT